MWIIYSPLLLVDHLNILLVHRCSYNCWDMMSPETENQNEKIYACGVHCLKVLECRERDQKGHTNMHTHTYDSQSSIILAAHKIW